MRYSSGVSDGDFVDSYFCKTCDAYANERLKEDPFWCEDSWFFGFIAEEKAEISPVPE